MLTIPIFVIGEGYEAGQELGEATILDIAPTVMQALDLSPYESWKGKPVA